MYSLVSDSASRTEAIGAIFASFLGAGDFVALVGELGAGKTCFARGVAAGLDIDTAVPVTSPTYTLMNSYQGRLPLYHFDLYRIDGDEASLLGFEDYFYGNGICLVEWAERLSGDLPTERVEIQFSHVEGDARRLQFVPVGEKFDGIVARMFDVLTREKMF